MIFTRIFHRILHIPYKLHVAVDEGSGVPIIFLHGVASDSTTWKNVLPIIPTGYRAIAIDLLGFGSSPKPKDCNYGTSAHALSVLKTIRKLRLNKPAIIVGHSMGGIIAIEIAKRQPKLVAGIVLVSTPLYNSADIIEATSKYAKTKKSMSNGLFIVYERIAENENTTLKAAQAVMKLSPSSNSFVLDRETWLPFKRSLTNTIMKQTSLVDVESLPMTVHIIYGKLDLLVQPKNYETLASNPSKNFYITSFTGGHMITKNGAALVIDAIKSILSSKR